MSTRYKASHIKTMIWWCAVATQECADSMVHDPQNLVSIHSFLEVIKIHPNTSHFFEAVSVQSASTKDRVMQVVATTCFGLQRCIDILDNSGLILTQPDSKEASDMLILHCKSYQWLAAMFFRDRLLLFKIRPKFHYVFHQAIQIRDTRLNLWAFATFGEESFIGKCKTIYCACHGKTVNRRFYERYLLCLALMVKRHSELESQFGVAP